MYQTVRMLLDMLVGRVQALREDENRELGASALEWAIIAAISVVIAVFIGGFIYKVVSDKSGDLQNCANKTTNIQPGAKC